MSKLAPRLCLLLALFSLGCGPSPNDNFENVFRATDSPDGAATAYLARTDKGGALGSLVHDVYLSENGSEENLEPVFHGYGDCDPAIEWRSNQLLVIQYAGEHCAIYDFHNVWGKRELASLRSTEPEQAARKGSRVEIMLKRVEAVSEKSPQ
ncbi:MAG: hypothetical protein ABI769_17100 [Pseudomonadota bacterium]